MADEISRIQLPNGNSYDVKDTVARQTLEHYKTPVTVTLAADGWSSTAPFSQTLKVAGITDSDNPIAKEVYDQSITLDAQKEIKKQTGYIDYGVTADGTVTFICLTNKPSVNITLTLSFMSGGSTISGEDPGTVRVALDNEIERAKAAEKTNADKIGGIDSQLDSMATKNDLDNEIERAKAAEKTNADKIGGIDSQLDSMATKNDLENAIGKIRMETYVIASVSGDTFTITLNHNVKTSIVAVNGDSRASQAGVIGTHLVNGNTLEVKLDTALNKLAYRLNVIYDSTD